MKNASKAHQAHKSKNWATIPCPHESHNDHPLKFVCTSATCDKDLLCDICIKQDHNKGHQENIIPIDDLLSFEAGKAPLKKIKFEGTTMRIDAIKDIILSKNSILKTYAQNAKEEVSNCKAQIKQIEETFLQLLASVVKEIEASYAKMLKNFKTHFNIFEYSALQIPKIRKDLETTGLKDPIEYKSLLTSIVDFEKGKAEGQDSFANNQGEAPSLDEYYKLLTDNINLKPVSTDQTKLVSRLESEVNALQKSISSLLPEGIQPVVPVPMTIKRQPSVKREIVKKTFDYTKAIPLESLMSLNRITALAVIDHKRIAIGSEGGMVEYWNVSNKLILQKTQAHTQTIKGMIAIGTKMVVTASRDGHIKVLGLPTLNCLHKMDGHSQGVTTICKFGNTNMFITGGMDNMWKVWDAQTGKMSISKSSNGINCIQVLQTSTRDKILSYKKLSMQEDKKDSMYLIAIGGRKDINLWLIDLNESREPYFVITLKGHEREVRSITDVGGNILISGGSDNSIRTWDLKDGSCKKVISKAHQNFITNIHMLQPDVFVSTGFDGVIKFWNVTNGAELKSLKHHKSIIYCLGFDGEGAMITAGDDQLIRIWK